MAGCAVLVLQDASWYPVAVGFRGCLCRRAGSSSSSTTLHWLLCSECNQRLRRLGFGPPVLAMHSMGAQSLSLDLVVCTTLYLSCWGTLLLPDWHVGHSSGHQGGAGCVYSRWMWQWLVPAAGSFSAALHGTGLTRLLQEVLGGKVALWSCPVRGCDSLGLGVCAGGLFPGESGGCVCMLCCALGARVQFFAYRRLMCVHVGCRFCSQAGLLGFLGRCLF